MLWMAGQASPLLDLNLQRLTHALDEHDIDPTSVLYDSFGLFWKIAARDQRNGQTATTPTNVSQYVHHRVLARGTAGDNPINPAFDLLGLPIGQTP